MFASNVCGTHGGHSTIQMLAWYTLWDYFLTTYVCRLIDTLYSPCGLSLHTEVCTTGKGAY